MSLLKPSALVEIPNFVDLLTEAGKTIYYNVLPEASGTAIRYFQLTRDNRYEDDRVIALAAWVNRLATTDWFCGIAEPASILTLTGDHRQVYFIILVLRPEWWYITTDQLNDFMGTTRQRKKDVPDQT